MNYKKERQRIKQALDVIKLYLPQFKFYRTKCFNDIESMLKFIAKESEVTVSEVKNYYSKNVDFKTIIMTASTPISVNLSVMKYVNDRFILFSLLHEIGHIELGHTDIECTSNKIYNKIEKQADNFAKKYYTIIEKKVKLVQQFLP